MHREIQKFLDILVFNIKLPNISPNLCIEGILRLHKLNKKILNFLCVKKG